MAKVEIPDDLLGYVVDALNCFTACVEGRRAEVEEIWFLEDDKTDTGGTFTFIAKRLQDEVGDNLRREDDSAMKRDPNLQDLLHRMKMRRKYGNSDEAA